MSEIRDLTTEGHWHFCPGEFNATDLPSRAGAHIRGIGGGGETPLASECDLKSVPFFFDTVLKLRPKIRVERRRINIYFCQ